MVKGEDSEAIQNKLTSLFETMGPLLTAKAEAEKAKDEAAKASGAAGEQTVDAAFTEVDSTKKD